MLSLNLGRLFRRAPPLPPERTLPPVPVAPAAAPPPQTGPWPPVRLAINERLWGPGFTGPGGEAEVLRLVRPLGASGDNRLLLVGMGAGGAANAIAEATHTVLMAVEADPALLAAAGALVGPGAQKRRLKTSSWDPALPRFGRAAYHNCLALEPMRHARSGVVLPALTAAIGGGGSLVVTNLTAVEPIDPADALIARWARLERLDPSLIPSEAAVSAMLDGEGMDLRIAEDISQRHMEQIVHGWQQLMGAMAVTKPDRVEAAFIVAEAELWLLRRRLIESGRLRLTRWHTIRKF